MKLNKKKVFTLAIALCLIATISLGSLAWFTDTDSVTNDFLIAGSEDEKPDDVFSVDVWEIGPDGTKDDDGITYPNILPGDELKKEVNIENTGSYAQYIRATVTVSDASIWQDIFGVIYVPLNKIVTDLNTAYDVYRVVYDVKADTLTYVLYYNAELVPDEISNLFKGVVIPEALTREQAAKMDGGFVLSVVADAVQTENVGANAVEAFATVGMGVEEGNFVINLDSENVEDVLKFMAKNQNAVAELNLNGITVEGDEITNKGGLTINGGVIDSSTLYNYGVLTLNGTVLENGNNGGYAIFSTGTTIFNDTTLNTNGGGINVQKGAQVIYNGGSIDIDSTQTSQRHVFYAAGAGTKVVINDGDFSFEAYRQRSYVCAQYGAVVEINGGTFGVAPNHSRWTYPIFTGQTTPETTDDGTVVIKGGTFGFNPTEWVADGYVAVESNGVWTVSAAQ